MRRRGGAWAQFRQDAQDSQDSQDFRIMQEFGVVIFWHALEDAPNWFAK